VTVTEERKEKRKRRGRRRGKKREKAKEDRPTQTERLKEGWR
jgi:hypothetical protein